MVGLVILKESLQIFAQEESWRNSKKSKPFFLKGILYTCSQTEAIEKSGFPGSQEHLSRLS
jgi:hypothetical protein